MNKSMTENPYIRLFIQYSLPLMVIGIISRVFPFFDFLYYLVPVILSIYILLALLLKLHKQLNINLILIVFSFPLYCIITVLWSLYPQITLLRSIYLIFMYAGILSAVFLYKNFFSEKGIGFLAPANLLIIAFSLFSLITNIPANSWTGGNGIGFIGFAGHQNTLAAALLFTLPGIIALGIGHSAKSQAPGVINIPTVELPHFLTVRILRLASFVLLLACNILLLFLTYSRASILALAVGIITYLLIAKSKKILLMLFSLTAVILVLYIASSPINHAINQYLNKDGGSLLGRRMILWEPSLEAAKSGGVIGFGYGVSAPDIKTPILTGSHYENGRYIREKGNSVLAMIEETGIIGLLLFLLPVFYIALKLFRSPNSLFTDHRKLITAALAAMLVHAQFEGWWVGVGSVSLPLFLIILFTLITSEKNNDVISNFRERSG